MNKNTYVIVSTTVADEKRAEILADLTLSAKLAACVQFWPIRSLYRWQGKVESGTEFILQCKTRACLTAPLQELIRANHPYELPEIIVTPIIEGHPPYLEWLGQETSSNEPGRHI